MANPSGFVPIWDATIAYTDGHPGFWHTASLRTYRVLPGRTPAAGHSPLDRNEFVHQHLIQARAAVEVLGADASAAVLIHNGIGDGGSYIADLATLTDGPAGVSGAGLVRSLQLPNGEFSRCIEQLSDGAEYKAYWDGSVWGSWSEPAASAVPVQVLSSANDGQTIAPGFYDLDADAAFSLTLEAPAGEYRFANSRLNLSATNTVTLNAATPATETFTDSTGAQVAGPMVLDVPGYGFQLVAESATDWHIVDAVIIPPSPATPAISSDPGNVLSISPNDGGLFLFGGGDVTMTVASLEPAASRQHITINNASGNQYGIMNNAFHLSEDPNLVGATGQEIALQVNVPKDLYVVGPSTQGLPSSDIEHNGTVNGIHVQATFDGASVNFALIAAIRHHPGPGDWATRSYSSLPASAVTILGGDLNLLSAALNVNSPPDYNTPSLIDVTVPGQTIVNGGNTGIPGQDTPAAGPQYLMYSATPVATRFPAATIDPNASTNYMLVAWNGSDFEWINNELNQGVITMAPDDVLFAQVDAVAPSVTPFATDGTTNGVQHVAAFGGLTVTAGQYNGAPNAGEFDAQGNLTLPSVQEVWTLQLDGTYQDPLGGSHSVDDAIALGATPAPAPVQATEGIDDTLAAAQALTDDRAIDLNGNELSIGGSGAGPTTVRDDGTLSTVGVYPLRNSFAYVQGAPVLFDMLQGHELVSSVDDVTFGDIPLANPTNLANSAIVTLKLSNGGSAPRTFTFGTAWVQDDGTQMPDVEIPGGQERSFTFMMSAARLTWVRSIVPDPALPSWATSTQDPVGETNPSPVANAQGVQDFVATFTPDVDGAYVYRFGAADIQGTVAHRMGSSAGAADIVDGFADLSIRPDPANPVYETSVDLTAGVEYFVSYQPGGASFATGAFFEIRPGYQKTFSRSDIPREVRRAAIPTLTPHKRFDLDPGLDLTGAPTSVATGINLNAADFVVVSSEVDVAPAGPDANDANANVNFVHIGALQDGAANVGLMSFANGQHIQLGAVSKSNGDVELAQSGADFIAHSIETWKLDGDVEANTYTGSSGQAIVAGTSEGTTVVLETGLDFGAADFMILTGAAAADGGTPFSQLVRVKDIPTGNVNSGLILRNGTNGFQIGFADETAKLRGDLRVRGVGVSTLSVEAIHVVNLPVGKGFDFAPALLTGSHTAPIATGVDFTAGTHIGLSWVNDTGAVIANAQYDLVEVDKVKFGVANGALFSRFDNASIQLEVADLAALQAGDISLRALVVGTIQPIRIEVINLETEVVNPVVVPTPSGPSFVSFASNTNSGLMNVGSGLQAMTVSGVVSNVLANVRPNTVDMASPRVERGSGVTYAATGATFANAITDASIETNVTLQSDNTAEVRTLLQLVRNGTEVLDATYCRSPVTVAGEMQLSLKWSGDIVAGDEISLRVGSQALQNVDIMRWDFEAK